MNSQKINCIFYILLQQTSVLTIRWQNLPLSLFKETRFFYIFPNSWNNSLHPKCHLSMSHLSRWKKTRPPAKIPCMSPCLSNQKLVVSGVVYSPSKPPPWTMTWDHVPFLSSALWFIAWSWLSETRNTFYYCSVALTETYNPANPFFQLILNNLM